MSDLNQLYALSATEAKYLIIYGCYAVKLGLPANLSASSLIICLL